MSEEDFLLLEEIDKRLSTGCNAESERPYWGFDMSGYILDGGETRDICSQECSRARNFLLFSKLFHDYCPMDLDNFKLHCWKGCMWWGDKLNRNPTPDDWSGACTRDIVFWIIKNFGKKPNVENQKV